MSNLQTISPARVVELMRDGAVLIDIREADEHAREHVPGARHHALSRIDKGSPVRAGDDVLIFHCRSGARTKVNATKLAAAAPACETYILDGGIDAWKKAGLPVSFDRRQPLDIMRQVQMVAGSLVLAGVMLGYFATPAFFAVSGFIGAGLLFAGVTGSCGMAKMMVLMPWNRPSSAATK